MKDEATKINKNKEKKQEIVASLVEKMQKAKAIVFTNYQGLTHKQLEEFKKHIKEMGTDFVVAKNSLILRSAKDAKVKIEDEKSIEGPTGTMFIYEDIVAPLKQLAKTVKELGLPNVKIGFLDGKQVTSEEVMKLSKLPSREMLLAQLVGTLKGPIYGLHRGLRWNIQKLAIALGEIAKSKPAESNSASNAQAATPVPTAEPVAPAEPKPEEKPEEKVEEAKEETSAEKIEEQAPVEAKEEEKKHEEKTESDSTPAEQAESNEETQNKEEVN